MEPAFRQAGTFAGKIHLNPASRDQIETRLRLMLDALNKDVPGARLIAKAELVSVLVHLGRAHDPAASPRPAPEGIVQALALIEERFDNNVRLTDLAKTAGLSPAGFCEAFRRHTGQTPMAYLQEIRLDEARRLLSETSKSMTEIALASGFCDSSHLAKVFRAREGLPPAAWRRGRKSSGSL